MYAGQQFGNYRLLRMLGEGGFAQVYLGEHIHLKTLAAIKVLTTKLIDEEIVHFRNEARLCMTMEHPHIVRVLDFGMQESVPFLVMSYAARGSLRGDSPRGSRLPLSQVISYVNQVASALQYIHDRKLIYRDVKPENMLITQNGSIALSDFGIAVVAHSERSMSRQETIRGTGVYMAPELFEGKPRTASDQYALGIVAYEWLTGTPPFHGTLAQLAYLHACTPPKPLHEQISITSHVEQVLLKALAKNPKERFPTVQDFAHALEEAAQSAHQRPGKPPLSSSVRPSSLVTSGSGSGQHLLIPNTPLQGYQAAARRSSLALKPDQTHTVEDTLLSSIPSSDPIPSCVSPHVVPKAKHWLRILPIVLLLGLFLLASGAVLNVGIAFTKSFSLASTGSLSGENTTTVTIFLSDLKQQDYSQAYSYLDDSLLLVLTPMDFTRQAQAADRCYGPVISYTEVAGSKTTQNGKRMVAYHLTRTKVSRPYLLSFSLQQDPGSGEWLISHYGNDLGPDLPMCS